MLEPAAVDGVKERVLAVRHAIDHDDMARRALGVILRELAERTLGLAHARQDAAFEHDLGLGRHAQVVGQALHHLERRAVQRAGDVELVAIERQRSPATPRSVSGSTPITIATSSASPRSSASAWKW